MATSRRSFLRASAAIPLVGLPAVAAADSVVELPAVPLPAVPLPTAPAAVDREPMYLIGSDYWPGDPIYPPSLHGMARSKTKARVIRQAHQSFGEKDGDFIRKGNASYPDGSHYVAGYWDWDWDEWLPAHLLSIPPCRGVYTNNVKCHGRGESWNLSSRADAFAMAVEENKAQAEKVMSGERGTAGRHDHYWCVVLQVGRPVQSGYWSIEVVADGGLQEVKLVRPVRLIRPTAEEIARYAPDRLKFAEPADSAV